MWPAGGRVQLVGELQPVRSTTLSSQIASDRGKIVYLIDDGAEVIDVGGESTRPGAALVSPEAEQARVVPVIEKLSAQSSVPISIDTTKASVARAAIEAGAIIVNDISGLTFDDETYDVIADAINRSLVDTY